ncbi:MAG: YchJ family protein [Microbacteriaceae bacterium]
MAERAERCPCLSGDSYADCCERFHSGSVNAPTAERLMRSRYTAYARGNADYVRATWHPSTRPDDLHFDPDRRWYRLDVRATTSGGPFDTRGTVTFEAFYRDATSSGSQLEKSTFVREEGHWYYVDGI